jgi:hypothetical protein
MYIYIYIYAYTYIHILCIYIYIHYIYIYYIYVCIYIILIIHINVSEAQVYCRGDLTLVNYLDPLSLASLVESLGFVTEECRYEDRRIEVRNYIGAQRSSQCCRH